MFSNQSQSTKTNESTMDIKHASACALNSFFLFSLFFLLNKWPLKVSRKYIRQDFDAKRENKFLVMQLMSAVVKTIMVYMIDALHVESLMPRDQ
jgi:hypothetical protein